MSNPREDEKTNPKGKSGRSAPNVTAEIVSGDEMAEHIRDQIHSLQSVAEAIGYTVRALQSIAESFRRGDGVDMADITLLGAVVSELCHTTLTVGLNLCGAVGSVGTAAIIAKKLDGGK